MTKNEFDWLLQGMIRAFRVVEKDECEETVECVRDVFENLNEV